MNGETVSGWQEVTPGSDLELTFKPDSDRNVKQVVVDGEKMEFIDSYTLENVSAWSAGTHTVEVTFGSRDIEITAVPGKRSIWASIPCSIIRPLKLLSISPYQMVLQGTRQAYRTTRFPSRRTDKP